jgi:hypothetical protein
MNQPTYLEMLEERLRQIDEQRDALVKLISIEKGQPQVAPSAVVAPRNVPSSSSSVRGRRTIGAGSSSTGAGFAGPRAW